MLKHTKYSQEVREKIFFFSGFDDELREIVCSLSDGNDYLLVGNELFDEFGELQLDLSRKFQEGYYLGHGCLGNGTSYWNKKEGYKFIGLIESHGKLNIYTKDTMLIKFLYEEIAGEKNEAD